MKGDLNMKQTEKLNYQIVATQSALLQLFQDMRNGGIIDTRQDRIALSKNLEFLISTATNLMNELATTV